MSEHPNPYGGFIDMPAPAEPMSLRDWFAGQATEADVAQFIPETIGEACDLYHRLGFGPKLKDQECIRYMRYHPVSKELRYWAKYQHADALIAARATRRDGAKE